MDENVGAGVKWVWILNGILALLMLLMYLAGSYEVLQ